MLNGSSSSYPSSSDPYNISSDHHTNDDDDNNNNNMVMSFAGYQEEWNTQDNTQNPLIPNTSFDLRPPPLAAAALPLMNAGGFPFYSPSLASDEQYHHHSSSNFIKSEDIGGNLCGSTVGSARIGLNLGHRTYFSSGDALTIDRLLTARAHQQQLPRCQAEGCKADLSGSKHYHRRHKVCEFHSKATVVIAGGIQQRFCQQCSRFHVLAEFDESKRSCRRRLADHNRRRRKPPHQNTTNSSDSSKTTKLCTTTTTTTSKDHSSSTSNVGSHEGNQRERSSSSNKATLSLGAHQQFGPYHQHPSTSNSNGNFYHQRVFGDSSSISVDDASQSNVLHLGQSMFEVDFM